MKKVTKSERAPLTLNVTRIRSGVKAGPIRMVDDPPGPWINTCSVPCLNASRLSCI